MVKNRSMKKFTLWPVIGFCCVTLLGGCAGSGSPVVARVGSEPITLEEFEEQYAKNNGGWEKASTSTLEERERFLDLLVKFKLKVKEAYDRGLLADSSVRNELDGYEVTVASAYMIDKEFVEPMVRQMFERKKEEVRASHILIRVDAEASSQDTLAAYNKAMNIIGMIPNQSFDSLAVAYSQDQSVSVNKGDVGYFTTGRMVPEFEDAAFGLAVGQVTKFPVRSQFGYHIIKLTGRAVNKGAVHVSHILRRFADDQKDSTIIKDSTEIIYRLVKGGMDFAEAAKRYSQDPSSGANGGDIGFYERGRIPPNVEEVFFSTPVDSIPEPLRMPYGYHIFKITGYQQQPKLQDVEKDLRQQYQQMRYNIDYKNFVNRLRREYHVVFDTLTIGQLSHAFDTTTTPANSMWSDTVSSDLRKRIVFRCQDRAYSVNDFITHVEATGEFRSMVLNPKNVQYMVERMSEAKLVDEYARLVPKRYPAFSKLLKEYQDGILLYRIEQDEVWKKVVVNDSLLEAYYQTVKEKYRWPDRVNFAEILFANDSVAQIAYKEIRAGKDFGEAAEQYTLRAGYREKKGIWGLTPNPTNEFSRYAALLPADTIPPPFAHVGGYSIIKVLEKDSSHVKTFEEAKPELMSAYQEYASKLRQDEWIAELKKQHPVVLNKEILTEAFKRKQVASQ